MVFSRLLLISDDMTWQVYVTDFQVLMDNDILRTYSPILSLDVIPNLIQRLDSSVMCSGNFEPQFVEIAATYSSTHLARNDQVFTIT